MLAAVDVQYQGEMARAACVRFAAWSDAIPQSEQIVEVATAAPYQPGNFYLRELPALIEVLAAVSPLPEIVVVDGYVWLDSDRRRPGLGARLRDALAGQVAVVGVAKNRFEGAAATELLRSASRRPLYVTAVGIAEASAVAGVAAMHGPFRIPTLLARADALARGRED